MARTSPSSTWWDLISTPCSSVENESMLELDDVMLIVDDATLVIAVGKLSVDDRERGRDDKSVQESRRRRGM